MFLAQRFSPCSSSTCYFETRFRCWLNKLCCNKKEREKRGSQWTEWIKDFFSQVKHFSKNWTRLKFFFFFSFQPNSQLLQSKPPKCPQNSLSHLRGLVELCSNNQKSTKVEICATPPQNRRRFFIPKHLKSPFGIYKNRSNENVATSEPSYTFSGNYFFHQIRHQPLFINSWSFYP